MQTRQLILAVLSPSLGLVFSHSLHADTVNPVINWGVGAQSISGDSDVSTSGSLINAYNMGTSAVVSTTVNTVTFAPYAFPSSYSTQTVTIGNYTFTEDPGLLVSYSNLGSASGPFTTLSSGYQTLLSSAGGADTATTITLSLNGLTVGQQYLLQVWLNDSANSFNLGQSSVTVEAGNSISLDGNRTNATGGLGQYAIGTFTATTASAPITFANLSTGTPYLNAFQLRAIPEPSTVGLLGVGGVILLRRRRSC